MIRDIFFVFVVLSVASYAHTKKEEIINFIEVYEKKDILLVEESLWD